MKYKKLYVAATGQHVGKTTSTLGLVYALRKIGHDVGYCKPVGQEFVDLGTLKADKDALLFSNFMDFQLDASIHSPVILGRGATSAYLDDPKDFDYDKDIMHATSILENNHETVVYEGTGHPGVGSVVNLSNADVAKMLDAKVIMVVKGGIGNTIDKLQMALSVFREKNVPVVGVIVNKGFVSKS
ncbi:MAG: AAA family ATPase [Bacteroidia bacterium]